MPLRCRCTGWVLRFLLEVEITGSKDGFVTSQRAADAMRTAELLLAGLVNNSIRPLTARSMYGYWVHPPGDDYRATAYLQPHYHCDMPESDEFSPETLLAPVAAVRELFGPYGMTAGTPLCIPDGLTEASCAGARPGRRFHACHPRSRHGDGAGTADPRGG